MNFTLHYTPTYEDLLEFQKVDLKLSQKKGTSIMASRAMVGCLVILVILLLIFVLFREQPPAAPRPAVAAPATSPLLKFVTQLVPWLLIFVVVWFFFLRKMQPSQTRRAWEANSSHLRQPTTAEITPDYLRISTPIMKMEHTWPGLHRFVEGPNVFLIYVAPASAHVIPKRAFANPAEIDAFRQFVRSLIVETTGGFPVLPSPSAASHNTSPNPTRGA